MNIYNALFFVNEFIKNHLKALYNRDVLWALV